MAEPVTRVRRQFSPVGRTINIHAEELGVGLVVLGLAILTGAAFHYLHVARAIDNDSYEPSRIGIIATVAAVMLLGGTSLVWLLR